MVGAYVAAQQPVVEDEHMVDVFDGSPAFDVHQKVLDQWRDARQAARRGQTSWAENRASSQGCVSPADR